MAPAPASDRPVIVLLAAGGSRRHGSPKQLAQIDGEPMVRRVARIASQTASQVIVVTGAHAVRVEAALAGLPVQAVRCEDWRQGMGSSLGAGVREVRMRHPATSGVLLVLADQPLVETAMLTRMLQRHQQVPGAILASGHQQALGPPVLFPADCLPELARWSGRDGASALLRREAQRVERCLAWVGEDVDTPEALQRVNALLAKDGADRCRD